MTIAEQTTAFLSELFSTAPFGTRVEIRNVPGSSTLEDVLSLRRPELETIGDGDWYFSVLNRDRRGQVISGSLVWCDIDNCPDPEDLSPLIPSPSAIVQSGHGTHLYWKLSAPVDPGVAVRLAKLAAIAYGGDPQVVEPQRVMRLPGSYNNKRNERILCKVYSTEMVTYTPEELEEVFVQRLIFPRWVSGARNSLLLGLSAVLSRAGWDADRLTRCVRAICEISGDEDPISNRITVALSTLQKFELGETITAQPLRESLGNDFQILLDGLGISEQNGDLLYDGEVIGNLSTFERDFVRWAAASPEWSFVDGSVARWASNRWRLSSEQEITAWTFQQMAALKVSQNGDQQDFNATSRLASQMTEVLVGILQQRELPPMPENLLPLRNGVLDLNTLDIIPHNPANASRWVLDATFDPSATAPEWEKFLSETVPDEASFLQEWVGYCLTPGNPYERMLWLYGPPGTGKSTFIKTVSRLFGPAMIAIKVDNITPYTVASLAPARVAVSTEMSPHLLRTTTLKALVSGDPVDGRHPYGRPFTVQFLGKFMCASNSLPPVDEGEGLWRRIGIVSFSRVPQVPDEKLGLRLLTELPGILNWAIAGLRRMRELEHWPLPTSVTRVVAEYRDATDLFSRFAEEELDFTESGVETPIKEIYIRYVAWMKDRVSPPLPLGPAFYHELRRFDAEPVASPRRVQGRAVRVWKGVKLLEESF